MLLLFSNIMISRHISNYELQIRVTYHASNYTAGTNFAGHFDVFPVLGHTTPSTMPPTWIALIIGASIVTFEFLLVLTKVIFSV